MRSARRPPSDDAPPTPSLITQHPAAAAAASCAMRSGQIPSRDPRGPYNQLDDPANFAGLRQLPRAGHHSSGANASMGQQYPTSSATATPHQSTGVSGRPAVVDDIGPAAAISPIQERDGIDGRNSSVSSPFRQVHKAKSMWIRQSNGDHQARTMTHSKSFSRGNPRSTQKDQYPGRNDDDDKGRLRSYISAFSPERTLHNPFRKTLRETRESTASPSNPADQSRGGSHKHRSISNSIKSGFNRVFGRSKHTDATARPSPLSGSSYGAEPVVTSPSKRNVEGVPPGDSRNAPPPPRPLVQSSTMDSLCGSESRVTSWNNSSLTNTVTSLKPEHGESLSSIREDENLDQLLPPPPSRVVSGTQNEPPSAPLLNRNLQIDCQDLCSAIQHEIDRHQRSWSNQAPIVARVPERRVIPRVPASHSQYGRRTVRRVPSQEASVPPVETNEAPVFGWVPERRVVPEMPGTLRRVPSQETSISPDSFATASGERSSAQKGHLRPVKPLKRRPSESSPLSAPQEECDTLMIPRLRDARRNVDSPSVDSGIRSVNPSERANIVDDALGTPISRRRRESRSRIALSNSDPSDSNDRVPPGADMGVRDVHNAFPVWGMKRDYSPSIYSRTTSGIALSRPDVDIVGRSHDESGMATVFSQQRMYVSPRPAPPNSTSENFLTTSADWQRWLNSEVGKLGQTKPPREHVREYEQFQDEDEQFQEENEQFQEQDEQLTNVARDDNAIALGNDVISTTLTPAKTSSFTTPGHGHTKQRSPTRNFSWPYPRPSANMPVQQDLSENTVGDAYTPSSAPAMNPAINPAMDPAMDPETNSATDSATDPDNYASPASGDPVSPSSVLRERLHNQYAMGLGSQPLQPPDTPTPKAANKKQVSAQSQRNKYAVRRAALVRHQRSRQERSLNNENHRDQPDESTGVMQHFLEIREMCEQVATSRSTWARTGSFPTPGDVEEFLKHPRGPQNPPKPQSSRSDSDADMGGLI
ncbi:uncharacterized protein N7515_000314 [Penicillium bovifimosum]|uniref:Uncharacterized protein n=1 Tax=Penicillium bovifimosum TaxID=126998 RepID=A0A9W9LBB8_9EURO|nr:uncharacterized protein N7515_000314 [Penicillium bovifimosum]KAJ5145750.1 hypothetical protein N7515_000314 [Penicillium bovifimosum]